MQIRELRKYLETGSTRPAFAVPILLIFGHYLRGRVEGPFPGKPVSQEQDRPIFRDFSQKEIWAQNCFISFFQMQMDFFLKKKRNVLCEKAASLGAASPNTQWNSEPVSHKPLRPSPGTMLQACLQVEGKKRELGSAAGGTSEITQRPSVRSQRRGIR